MKVRELVEKLLGFNQELPVVITDHDTDNNHHRYHAGAWEAWLDSFPDGTAYTVPIEEYQHVVVVDIEPRTLFKSLDKTKRIRRTEVIDNDVEE